MKTQSTTERIQLIKEQTKRLRLIYASGKPLYPPDAFKDLARQVDSMNLTVKEGEIHSSIDKGGRPKCLPKFTTLNIFGDKIEEEVAIHSVLGPAESGSLSPGGTAPWKSTIPTVTIPHYSIRYNSYPNILSELALCERDGTPVHWTDLCPLQVKWMEQARDPKTDQVVPPFEVWPLEDVQEAFEAGIKEWEATEACQRLRASLQSAAIATTVTKIVAFGCATMSGKFRQSTQAGSIQQHAMLLTLKDALQKTGIEISCFAQDPIYSETDVAILGRAGITVLPDPEGFLEVDNHSVVVTCGPNVPVREVVLDLARPSMMIWRACLSEEEYDEIPQGRMCDPDTPRVRSIIQAEYTDTLRLTTHLDRDLGCLYVRRT